MAHSPESPELYVCESCQVVYAGTPILHSAGEHTFEAPDSCEVCGGEEFISTTQWVHHHS